MRICIYILALAPEGVADRPISPPASHQSLPPSRSRARTTRPWTVTGREIRGRFQMSSTRRRARERVDNQISQLDPEGAKCLARPRAHVMRRDLRMRTLTYAYVCALGSAIIAMQCILRAPTATPSVMKRSSGSRAIRRAPQDLRLRTSWPGMIVGVNVIELEEAQPRCQMRDGGATRGRPQRCPSHRCLRFSPPHSGTRSC